MTTRLFKTVEFKTAGERRATAHAVFINRKDQDLEAFAPHFAAPATVQLGRAHDQLLGGGSPPFGIARLADLGDRYDAHLEFFDTPRGLEEYSVSKALAAAGVPQSVSIGYTVTKTGPVPEGLREQGVRRYIEQAKFIELSLVGVGAVPGAQITQVKCDACGAKDTDRVTKPQPPRPADLKEWLPSWEAERVVRRIFAAAIPRWSIKSRPVLRWFRGPIARCRGQYLDDQSPPEVWIATGMDEQESALTTAHELWHHHERETGQAFNDSVAESQALRLLEDMRDPRMAMFFQPRAS